MVSSTREYATTLIHLYQTKNPAAILRLLHYPPQTGPVDERVIGIGAHTESVIYMSVFPSALPH